MHTLQLGSSPQNCNILKDFHPMCGGLLRERVARSHVGHSNEDSNAAAAIMVHTQAPPRP